VGLIVVLEIYDSTVTYARSDIDLVWKKINASAGSISGPLCRLLRVGMEKGGGRGVLGVWGEVSDSGLLNNKKKKIPAFLGGVVVGGSQRRAAASRTRDSFPL